MRRQKVNGIYGHFSSTGLVTHYEFGGPLWASISKAPMLDLQRASLFSVLIWAAFANSGCGCAIRAAAPPAGDPLMELMFRQFP